MAEFKKYKEMTIMELIVERQKRVSQLNIIDFYINKKDKNYNPVDYQKDTIGEEK